MVIAHKLKMNLEEGEVVQRLEMPLGDVNSRSIQMLLYARYSPWAIPEDVTVLVRFRKPDGTMGVYDTMPDGSLAWSVEDNMLTVFVAPQVLAASGTVELYAEMYQEAKVLHTFAVEIWVKAPFGRSVGADGTSQDYYYVTNVLRGPVTAQAGQVLTVKNVDTYGRVADVEAQDFADLLDDKNAAVLYTRQTLTADQMLQARLNIGAADRSVVDGLCDYFDNGILVLSDYKTSGKCRIAADNRKLTVFHQGTDATRTLLTDEDGSRILEEAIAGRVLYTPQTLDVNQKAQARANIAAVSLGDLENGIEFVDKKDLNRYRIYVNKNRIVGYDETENKYYTYLTSDDKQSIIDATLAALPIYSGEVEEV